MALHQGQCEACRSNAPRATPEERSVWGQELPHWTVESEHGVDRLQRVFTFADFDHQQDVTKRIGAFVTSLTTPWDSDHDGIWIESDGSVHSLCIAKNGAVTTIPQSAWDDPLDGSGPSGSVYDFSKFTVFEFNFLYLGGTRIQFNIILNGAFYTFHT